jgi:hypothetical protein
MRVCGLERVGEVQSWNPRDALRTGFCMASNIAQLSPEQLLRKAARKIVFYFIFLAPITVHNLEPNMAVKRWREQIERVRCNDPTLTELE